MDEHTKQITRQMLILLQDYRQNKIGLRRLVDGLEGSMNVIEEKLPKTFYDQWFLNWGGLEETLAIDKEQEHKKAISEDVITLEKILNDLLVET